MNLMVLSCLLLASCAEQEPLADPIAPPLSVAVAAESTDEVTTGGELTHLATVLEVYSFYERGMYLPVYRDDLVFYAPVYKFYMNWGASRNVNGWFADSPLNVPGSSSSAYDRTDICNIAPLQ